MLLLQKLLQREAIVALSLYRRRDTAQSERMKNYLKVIHINTHLIIMVHRMNVSVTKEQAKFIELNDLKPSWILQQAIIQRMEHAVKGSADVLREEGYLSLAEYQRIIDDFDKKTSTVMDDVNTKVFQRDRNKLVNMQKKLRRIKKRIDEINAQLVDEIDTIDIQTGKKKPSGGHKLSLEDL